MDKKGLLLLIYFGAFIGPFGGNSVLPLIPLLESNFNVGIEVIALTITAFMGVFASFQVFSGALSDVYGRKKLVMLGSMVYALGAAFAALSEDIISFLVARLVQGAGAAFIFPIMLAMVGDFFPYQRRGRIMGGYAASTSSGIALGPLIGGLLALYSWRYVFVLIAVLVLMMIPACQTQLKSITRREGMLLRTLPNIISSALKQFNVLLTCIVGLLVFLMSASTLTFLSDFLGKPPLEVSATEIGLLLFIGGIAAIFVAPVAGLLIDAIGRKTTAIIGGILMVSAFLVFTLFSRTYWQFLTPLVTMIVGQSMIFTSMGTVVIDSATPSRGTASSIYNTFRFMGYGIGPALMSPIYGALGLTGTWGGFTLAAIMVLIIVTRIKTKNSRRGII